MFHCHRKKIIFIGIVIIGAIGWLLYRIFFSSLPILSCIDRVGTTFMYQNLKIHAVENGYETVNTVYPGCDKHDIFLWTCTAGRLGAQTWSACNVGASHSFSGNTIEGMSDKKSIASMVGGFFSWGDNHASSLLEQEQKKTGSPSDWSMKSQGPCAKGYHVPTQTEWREAMILSEGALAARLVLPDGGFLGEDGNEYSIGEGHYWSSTPTQAAKDPFADSETVNQNSTLAFSTNTFTSTSEAFTETPVGQDMRFSVRCIRDTIVP